MVMFKRFIHSLRSRLRSKSRERRSLRARNTSSVEVASVLCIDNELLQDAPAPQGLVAPHAVTSLTTVDPEAEGDAQSTHVVPTPPQTITETPTTSDAPHSPPNTTSMTPNIHDVDVMLEHQYIPLQSGLPIPIVAGTEEYLVQHVKDVECTATQGSPGCVRLIAHHPLFMPTIDRHVTMLLGTRTCVVKVLKRLSRQGQSPGLVRSTDAVLDVHPTHRLSEHQYKLLLPGMYTIVHGGDYDYLVQLADHVSTCHLHESAPLGEVRIIAADCFSVPKVESYATVLLGESICIVKVIEKFHVPKAQSASPPSRNARHTPSPSARAGDITLVHHDQAMSESHGNTALPHSRGGVRSPPFQYYLTVSPPSSPHNDRQPDQAPEVNAYQSSHHHRESRLSGHHHFSDDRFTGSTEPAAGNPRIFDPPSTGESSLGGSFGFLEHSPETQSFIARQHSRNSSFVSFDHGGTPVFAPHPVAASTDMRTPNFAASYEAPQGNSMGMPQSSILHTSSHHSDHIGTTVDHWGSQYPPGNSLDHQQLYGASRSPSSLQRPEQGISHLPVRGFDSANDPWRSGPASNRPVSNLQHNYAPEMSDLRHRAALETYNRNKASEEPSRQPVAPSFLSRPGDT